MYNLSEKEEKKRVTTVLKSDLAKFIKVQAAKEGTTQGELIERSVKNTYKDTTVK